MLAWTKLRQAPLPIEAMKIAQSVMEIEGSSFCVLACTCSFHMQLRFVLTMKRACVFIMRITVMRIHILTLILIPLRVL